MSTGSSSRWSAGDGADDVENNDDDDDDSRDALVAAGNGEGVVAAGMSNVIDEGTVRLEKSNDREAGAAEDGDDDEDDDETLKRDEADVVAEVGMVRLEKSNAGADDAEAEDEEGGTGARTSSREEPEAPQKASVSARRRPSDGTNDAKLKKRTCTSTRCAHRHKRQFPVPHVSCVVCVVSNRVALVDKRVDSVGAHLHLARRQACVYLTYRFYC
jgi:hypothetical protein